MRFLLAALALACVPGAAIAQQSESTSLRQLGDWGQKLVAAQQPVVESYQRCSPTIREVVALMEVAAPDRSAAERLFAEMRACVADTRAAATRSRDAMAAMPPMPAMAERLLGVDSRDVLRQSAAAIAGMIGYLEKAEESLSALSAGDAALAARKEVEARSLAGSALDGQILLLETLRKSLPMRSHKSMADIRLAIQRVVRAITVRDPEHDSGELAAALKKQGANARAAAAELRTNWRAESQPMRALGVRLKDPQRTAMIAAADEAFERIAQAGDQVAAILDALPSGSMSKSDALRVIDAVSSREIQILEAVRAMSVSLSQVR